MFSIIKIILGASLVYVGCTTSICDYIIINYEVVHPGYLANLLMIPLLSVFWGLNIKVERK